MNRDQQKAQRAQQLKIYDMLTERLGATGNFVLEIVELLQDRRSARGSVYTPNMIHLICRRGTPDYRVETELVKLIEERCGISVVEAVPGYVPYSQRIVAKSLEHEIAL